MKRSIIPFMLCALSLKLRARSCGVRRSRRNRSKGNVVRVIQEPVQVQPFFTGNQLLLFSTRLRCRAFSVFSPHIFHELLVRLRYKISMRLCLIR